MDRLRVTSARYAVRDEFFPVLILTVDGREAVLSVEAKPTLSGSGLVRLGGEVEWEAILPEIDFEVPGDPGNVLTLKGFTRDPVILGLWRRFRAECDAGTFAVGPVPIPPG